MSRILRSVFNPYLPAANASDCVEDALWVWRMDPWVQLAPKLASSVQTSAGSFVVGLGGFRSVVW